MSSNPKGRVASPMNLITDDLLLESYYAAVKLRLDPDFIRMLAIEMMRRNMKPSALRIGA